MAISPPSDIVLDVARAAEPDAVAAARAELLRKAGSSGKTFSIAEMDAPRNTGVAQPLTRMASAESLPEASKKFEAMVLQTFIGSMMPKNAESTYGQGIAGEMWKSQMAEKIADVVAERGGIGIARHVMGDFEMDGEKKLAVAGVSQSVGFTGAQPGAIAGALVDQIERQLAREIGTAAKPETGLFKD